MSKKTLSEKFIQNHLNDLRSMYDMYETIQMNIDKSIVSDIVECDASQLMDFSTYWQDSNSQVLKESMVNPYIPGDIIWNNTIPITDIRIDCDLFNRCRIVIFDKDHTQLQETWDSFVDDPNNDGIALLSVVGAIIFNDSNGNEYFDTLVYSHDQKIIFSKNCQDYDPKLRPLKADQLNAYSDSDGIDLRVTAVVLHAWYGMQLALLHPITKAIFDNPTRIKRDHKESMKTIMVDGKPKRAKYVRKHVIHQDNGVYDVLEHAMDDLISEYDKNHYMAENNDKPVRKYTRKTLLRRVIGHTRICPSGKTVWIEPYWKGVLRNMSSAEKYVEQYRDILR